MNIAILQFNPCVGDVKYNLRRICVAVDELKGEGVDLLLTPELSLCGYSPQDLLLEPQFFVSCQNALDALLDIDDLMVVVGHPWRDGPDCFNRMSVLYNGSFLAHHDKLILPKGEVFDECRYFSTGHPVCVFDVQGVCVGLLTCEDLWYPESMAETVKAGADLVLVANASPYHRQKWQDRHAMVRQRIETHHRPVVYAQYVGAQDELVFDGGSFAMDCKASVIWQAPQFLEHLGCIEYQKHDLLPARIDQPLQAEEECYTALCVGLRDYVHKNGFKDVVLGLSGGVDSALVLAIAVDALGPNTYVR